MPRDIRSELSAPFEDSDIEWRLQWADDEKGTGIAVPYVTNRAIQNRLDKTVGVDCWKNEYIPWHGDGKKSGQLCGISIYFADRSEWITKYDGAEDSDIEPVKGGLSDSMKRASVQWGIGRYLYSMDTVWVDTEKRGKTTCIKKTSQAKLDEAHRRTVAKMFGTGKPDTPATPPTQKPVAQKEAPTQTAPQTPVVLPKSDAPKKTPDDTYCIVSAVQQKAMSGQNTLLQLKDANGKTILAYMQGTNPAMTPGVWIENAVITKKLNQGVVFYTLDSFDLAASTAA